MLLIQMTGLSGAGKSTIAEATQKKLTDLGYKVELLDGDDYRKYLCPDLGFSKADRLENIYKNRVKIRYNNEKRDPSVREAAFYYQL